MSDKSVNIFINVIERAKSGITGVITGLGRMASAVQTSMRVMGTAIRWVAGWWKELLVAVSLNGLGIGWLLKQYGDAEASIINLKTALQSTGAEVDNNTARLLKFSDALQYTVAQENESIEAAMALGIRMGISADEIEAATKAAIGLTKFGLDMEGAMRAMARAEEDQYGRLQMLIPALSQITDEEEKRIYLTKLGMTTFKTMSEATAGYAKNLKLFRITVAEIGEAFGGLLVRGLKLPDLFRDISKWLREMMANLEKTGALKRWEAALNAWAAKWKKIIRDILQGDDATRNAAFKTMGAELGKGFAWAVDKMVEQLIARVPDIMNALVAAIPGAIAGALKQAAQRPSNFIAGIPGAQPLADRLIGLPTVSSGTKSLSGEMLREQRRTREAVEQQTEKLPAT